MFMTRAIAERVLTANGWLSHQPSSFQREVLERCTLQRYGPRETVFRKDGPLGGAYGLVTGSLIVNTAALGSTPRMINLGAPGAWTGEGCFLTRQRRRIELQALVETWLVHLPLAAMDQMAERDPTVIRNFAQILAASTDSLIRIVHDLQKPDADRRIASVLHRMSGSGPTPIGLSQEELGMMANASRKQVNAALQKFARAGWISSSYRSVCILEPTQLLQFTEGER